MEIFIVYDHPLDYPDFYVVRRFTANPDPPYEAIPDADIFIKHTSLEWIRERLLHCGLYRIDRDVNDDEKIVESWI